MTDLLLLSGDASWRSRQVRYYAGDWASVISILPDFELTPFAAGEDEPANPLLQTVLRLPLSKAERPIPVGVVSHTYTLAPHREVAALCREGLLQAGFKSEDLRYEAGLSELGEWMNFRIYCPPSHNFRDACAQNLDLRLECFNSVDGSSRLTILFGWYRLICSNGLVIGESMIEIRERHGHAMELETIPKRIRSAYDSVASDRLRMERWIKDRVAIQDIAKWADETVTDSWGKKAATRIFHICSTGTDVEIDDPFARGAATENPVRYLDRVPGCLEQASTKYDVCQALSFVASHRNNAEERLAWQSDIPRLLALLPARGF